MSFFYRSTWSPTDRLMAALAALVLAYASALSVPATFWFDPGVPVVADSTVDASPAIGFERKIRRDVRIRYQVTVRRVDTLSPVCDPRSGVITYRISAQLPEHLDLVWWTGGDRRCWPRAPGTYVMESCWEVVTPFWGLVPPKTVCRDSPPFRISGRAPA
ncbi:hypothetical protein [Ponticoccus alexandrii]|uniref:Uncharacterized protein n=1 Tax=Ponticoccus alexandrii TaxID=1943633 RepID=A0ABX7F967_9RHOB|nr:hypothetical protein [Ponticoccus alexandrii]ETA53956.1 hypothetical protein P279_00435 [Rhodobacteraceae bacterium PD-2]QRF66391.1 hypothetical protein GQA70_08750 [Ponticoccus alexandrii]